MANILYPPSRPQSVGEVLDSAFRIYSATLLKCLPYSFGAVVVGQLLSAYDLTRRHPTTAAALQAAQFQRLADPWWWGMALVTIILSVMFANAVLLRQYRIATGHAPSASAELGRALSRVPGMLLIGVLIILAFVVSFIPLGIVLGIMLKGVAAPGLQQVWVTAAVVIGALLAASWVVIRWVCTGPTYLLTERGALESMTHSWHLTTGHFWRLSAIYSVGVILMVVFYAFASVVGGMVALYLAGGDLAAVFAVTSAVIALLAALFTPFYHALVLAVYGDLSVRREGTDLAQRVAAPSAS